MILRPKYLLLTVFAVVLTACQREFPAAIEGGPVSVGFAAGSPTKTTATDDGLSTLWVKGDKVALWAFSATDGTAALSAHPFTTYSIAEGTSFFTSILDSPMQEGQYTYFACYPMPDEVGTDRATFTIPSTQDGKCGGGAELLFSDKVVSGALKAIDWKGGYDHSEFRLEMSPLLHRLRFYIYEVSGLEGERIEELKVSFPRSVAGKAEVPFADPQVSLQSGSGVITVIPDEPVPNSTATERHYINVAIAPTHFAPAENMDVTIHTKSKIAFASIPLKSKFFAAGHSTPVRIIPDSIQDCPRLFFRLDSNPIGEDIRSITFTAPSGCKWGTTGTDTFTYSPEGPIKTGTTFYTEFYDFEQFTTFSDKDVTVTFDSEHVRIMRTVHIGNLSGKVSETVALAVPWLLNENFDSVPTFSSDDEYKTAKAGSYSPHTFLGGWSGARCGAEAGKCIRIACRRETSARYDARVDSAPLNATFKKATNLLVEYDFGANNQYGGIPITWPVRLDGNVGQNFKLGYITTTSNYKSGDTNGTYEYEFYVKEYTGSYTNVPNNDSWVLHNIPAGDVVRISWRSIVEDQPGTTNTTAWLYLDNIKVTISNE